MVIKEKPPDRCLRYGGYGRMASYNQNMFGFTIFHLGHQDRSGWKYMLRGLHLWWMTS